MAADTETLRDGGWSVDQLPPGQFAQTGCELQAPAARGGSFLVNGLSPLALVQAETIDMPVSFHPQPAYDEYLQLDKKLVDAEGVPELLRTYDALKDTTAPKYLDAAGWAIAEVSLMGQQYPKAQRLAGLECALNCWARAIEAQKVINTHGEGAYAEVTRPLRSALAIATIPLLADMVEGDVRIATCRTVFEECLDIAKYNNELRHAAQARGDKVAMLEHEGFGHECNALLAINRRLTPSKFAIPAPARADSGHYMARQTHDLLVINQHWGSINKAIPIEVKGFGSKGDHRRYKALLLRGKIHLSPRRGVPEDTLEAFDAVYYNRGTFQQRKAAETVSDRVLNMIRDYCAGGVLAEVAVRHTTSFRDNRLLIKNHPGMILGDYIREHMMQAG